MLIRKAFFFVLNAYLYHVTVTFRSCVARMAMSSTVLPSSTVWKYKIDILIKNET